MSEDQIIKTLENHKLRKTQARVEILNLFFAENQALSHGGLESVIDNKIDRVTIYRTLNSFEEKGLLHKVFDSSGVVKYALCHKNCSDKAHFDEHIHFNCTVCGNTYCMDDTKIPQVSIPSGFKANSLYLIAEGVCSDCNN